MSHSTKTIVYDRELAVEACHFIGIDQPFPTHFHEYYVIGLIEQGERQLRCRNIGYSAAPGDLLLFHPGEPHACTQSDGGVLDYRAVNLSQERMAELAGELTGRRELPGFSANVLRDDEAANCFRALHGQLMQHSASLLREENLYFLLSILLQKYGQPFEAVLPDCPEAVDAAAAYMEAHFAERITLEAVCRCAGLSKSTLLRAFTRAKGMTPYRWLEAVRVNHARTLLEEGVPPSEAALRAGFSDQSHFTGYFSRFTGLTPGVYRDIFHRKCGGSPHET